MFTTPSKNLAVTANTDVARLFCFFFPRTEPYTVINAICRQIGLTENCDSGAVRDPDAACVQS